MVQNGSLPKAILSWQICTQCHRLEWLCMSKINWSLSFFLLALIAPQQKIAGRTKQTEFGHNNWLTLISGYYYIDFRLSGFAEGNFKSLQSVLKCREILYKLYDMKVICGSTEPSHMCIMFRMTWNTIVIGMFKYQWNCCSIWTGQNLPLATVYKKKIECCRHTIHENIMYYIL